jgi:hypothetical protein
MQIFGYRRQMSLKGYLLQQHHKLSEPFEQIGKAPHANLLKLHAVLYYPLKIC